MEHDALDIQQGSSLLLKVNNDSIGYDLESDDDIGLVSLIVRWQSLF